MRHQFVVEIDVSRKRSPRSLARAIVKAIVNAADYDVEGSEPLVAAEISSIRVTHESQAGVYVAGAKK